MLRATASLTTLARRLLMLMWLLAPLPAVEVRSDPSLGSADFRLQAADGAVERSWTDALDRLRPALVQALTRAAHDD